MSCFGKKCIVSYIFLKASLLATKHGRILLFVSRFLFVMELDFVDSDHNSTNVFDVLKKTSDPN